jgi:thiamine pyrophosphokinase
MLEAIVVLGGDPLHPGVVARLPPDRFVIAADSGLDHAEAAGIAVDLVVGDLDSVSPDALARAEAAGVAIERHPAAKDATDTELAVEAAVVRGATNVTLLTGGGDRLDHLLAGLLLLDHPLLHSRTASAWVGPAHVLALRGPGRVVVPATAGRLVTLLPVGGAAEGVTTAGLVYPLADEDLPSSTTRGVSNVAGDGPITVALRRGSLLVIVPEALS